MRKTVALILAALAGMSHADAQESAPMRLCLQASPYGHSRGFANFFYHGRITGNDPVPHYGYWVVAIDGGGQYEFAPVWAQNGGGVRGDSERVDFGVDNGSQYPLAFVILRVVSQEDYSNLRRAALINNPLTSEQLSLSPQVSELRTCIFDIDGDRAEGRPVNRSGLCSCG